MSVRLFLSWRIGAASCSAWPGRSQKAQVSGWNPSSWSALAPHRLKAEVMPQAPPETTRTAVPRTASMRAPAISGQLPRRIRARPAAEGGAPTGGGTRRFWTARVTTTIAISAAIVIAQEPPQPTWSESRIGGIWGRSATRGQAAE